MNEYAKNGKMTDADEVVLPGLVPNIYSCNALTALSNQGNAVTGFRINGENVSLREKVDNEVTVFRCKEVTALKNQRN